MSSLIDIAIDEITDPGEYLVTFTADIIPQAIVGKTANVGDWYFTLNSFQATGNRDEYQADITIDQSHGASGTWGDIVPQYAPIPGGIGIQVVPLIPILAAAAILVGLGIAYLTISKIEKIVQSPAADVGIVAGSLVAVFILFKLLTMK